jgi:hypothetical protein
MITLPQEILNQYTQEFYEILRTGKFSDGKINFTKTLGTVDRKATVLFTEMAWQKMQTLIREFDKEVAWHGVAERCEEKDTYLISDILVYPQEVTGSTVTTDQNEYEMWLMKQEDDVFNNIRMQGHSHVNMSTSPSSVDLNLYDGILSQLDSDMFYIFMIYNKRGEKTVKLYDLRENILFETADVTVAVKEVGDLTGFLEEAKELVVTKTYNYGAGVRAYGNSYPGYPSYGGYSAQKKEEPKKENSSLGKTSPLVQGNKSGKKRKGKRKKGNKSSCKQMSMSDYGYPGYLDDDDVYGGYSEFQDEYWRQKYGFE